MAILAFHEADYRFIPGITNYHPRRFRRILLSLMQAGYKIVSLADYIAGPAENHVSITFDDGYESFYKNVLPILQEFGLPAAVFVPAGYIGREASWDYLSFFRSSRHMTRSQIAECAAGGIEIGSHGLSHIDLTSISERFVRMELKKSKEILEDISGRKVVYLSYPFGRFDHLLENRAADCGYERGFSLPCPGKSRHGFTLPRYAVYSVDTLYSIMCKIKNNPLRKIEKIKGAIINAYAGGTIFINKFRTRNIAATD